MTRFERIVAQLERSNPDLASRLRDTPPSEHVRIEPARSGVPTAEMSLSGDDGPPRSLHSRFDPVREADRMVTALDPSGFVLCTGLGLGYHIERLLRCDTVAMVLVVDYDLAAARALLERWPHESLFSDPRLLAAVDEDPQTIARMVTERYVPIIHGDFRICALRGRVDAEPERFAGIAPVVLNALEEIIADFSAQQIFGKRWMRNTVRNLLEPGSTPPRRPTLDRTVVCAAGPSLNAALTPLHAGEPEPVIIATDSALSVLEAAQLQPALTVSVDAQQISYLHVLGRRAPHGVLAADLGIAPVVAGRFSAVHWVAGEHPFVNYLRSLGVGITRLETGDGSVTHTAVRLARGAGARDVSVVGADFGYPRAAAYARGSYLPVHALCHGSRLQPAFSTLYRFVLNRPALEREGTGTQLRYSSELMRRYRKRLSDLCASDAAPLNLAESTITDGEHTRGALREYARRLASLSSLGRPVWRSLQQCTPDERNLWTTLFPMAAFFHRSGDSSSHPLEQARCDTIKLIQRLLE